MIVQLPLNAEVVLTVPARAEFIHVLRAVTSSVAARLDIPYDDIDDLRIAIDEACAQLLEAVPFSESFELRIAASAAGIQAVVSVDGDAIGEWPPEGLEESLAWRVLQGLTDDVAFESRGSRAAIRVVKGSAGGGG